MMFCSINGSLTWTSIQFSTQCIQCKTSPSIELFFWIGSYFRTDSKYIAQGFPIGDHEPVQSKKHALSSTHWNNSHKSCSWPIQNEPKTRCSSLRRTKSVYVLFTWIWALVYRGNSYLYLEGWCYCSSEGIENWGHGCNNGNINSNLFIKAL